MEYLGASDEILVEEVKMYKVIAFSIEDQFHIS